MGHLLQLPALDRRRRRYPFSGRLSRLLHRADPLGTFDDITAATAANLVENPVNVTIAGYEQPLAKSHNVNIAFQRDIGFNTVAEIAYVGNFTRNHGRRSTSTACRSTCTATRPTW